MRFQRPFTSLYLALVFALFWGVSNAFAGETEELAALRSRFLFTVTRGHDACPTVADPTVREYVFVFEGGKGYDAYKRAYWMKEPQTLQSVRDYFWEGSDPADEIRSYEERLTEAPKGWSEEKFRVYRSFYPYIHRSRGNSALITAVTATIRDEIRAPVPKVVLYYPWHAWLQASKCAERLNQLHVESGSPARTSTIGFSLGGYSSILFARLAKKRNLRLTSVLTLDPVPFTFEIYKALRRQDNTTVIPAPDNHDRWINLFQTEDNGSMHTKLGRIPIRGSKVSGEVENLIPLEKGLPVATHMELPGCSISRGEIVRTLSE
jgi:hypothetical protein